MSASNNVNFAFALFANDGDRKDETTFKPFEKEPVTADFRILGLGDEGIAPTVEGSAINDKSRALKDIIRVNFKARINGKTVYLSGALNKATNKTNEKAPDFFGTLTNKASNIELDMAAWSKLDKDKKAYLACNAQPKREGAPAEAGVTETAGGVDDGGPFED